jgi:hypothetical protein
MEIEIAIAVVSAAIGAIANQVYHYVKRLKSELEAFEFPTDEGDGT